ncbi:SPRY domain-containing SOCS box protein 3 [Balamuthia mandrillaris]
MQEDEHGGVGPHHFPFLELPRELQLNTLVWLVPLVTSHNNNNTTEPNDGKDLYHCHLVCKRFRQVLQQDYFWQTVLQMSGVVEEGCSSLPDGVHSWKELYQLQYIHLVAEEDSDDLLRIDNWKRTVTLVGKHLYHTRLYGSRNWFSGLHYWEVTIDYTDNQIYIGVLPSEACNTNNGLIGGAHYSGWSITPYTGEIKGNHGKDVQPPPKNFRWFHQGDVIGVCLDIDAGRLDYWYNGEYLTGLQAESIKHQKPYRAAISLMNPGEKVTFTFCAKMPSNIPS